MLVQAGLCRTCSETTLLVFPRGGSNAFYLRNSSELASGHSSVVTCSALKKHYRQLLLHGHEAKTGSGRFDGREKSQQAGMADTHVG